VAYTEAISRQHPSCILFLIDQSESMADCFGGECFVRKADRLADAINRLLYELSIRCTRDQTEGARNYYEVGVISYGTGVGPALGGPLAGRIIVPIGEVADNPSRVEQRIQAVEDGLGGYFEEAAMYPVWFDPVAEGDTPMCEALRLAHSILEPWVASHRDSFPPIVINITDGDATDGDPREPAANLRQLSTKDGSLLLFNVHVSRNPGPAVPYPASAEGLPESSIILLEMSSVLPPHILNAAQAEGYDITPDSRGFVFNADIVEVIKFLDIGTRPKSLR
jgi:hypothetical protein